MSEETDEKENLTSFHKFMYWFDFECKELCKNPDFKNDIKKMVLSVRPFEEIRQKIIDSHFKAECGCNHHVFHGLGIMYNEYIEDLHTLIETNEKAENEMFNLLE